MGLLAYPSHHPFCIIAYHTSTMVSERSWSDLLKDIGEESKSLTGSLLGPANDGVQQNKASLDELGARLDSLLTEVEGIGKVVRRMAETLSKKRPDPTAPVPEKGAGKKGK